MGVRNKIIKVFGYFGIVLLTFIECYAISFVGMGTILSLVCAVWSFIHPLPALFSEHYGVIMLIEAVIPSIIMTVKVLLEAKK